MAKSIGQLIVQLNGKVVMTLPLNTPVLTLGRTPENGLPLPSQQVSRNHAELRIEAQGLLLTDLGSSNGTFIENQRLLPHQPRLIADGTTFRIGPYVLTYQATRPAESTIDQEEADQTGARPVVTPSGLPTTKGIPQPEPPTPTAQVTPQSEPPPPPAKVSPQPEPPAPPAKVSSVGTRAGASPTSTVLPTPLKRGPRLAKQALRSPVDSSNRIYQRFLPDIFHDDDFLRRFLMIFEDIWEPLEQRQDHIEMYFDPHTCPASFLAWLASWLDLSLNEHWPEARRRRLLAQATELYRWRGTQHGLIRMIEVCTGLTPEIRESSSQPFVFLIRVTLRPGPEGEIIDRALIEDLIRMHKPAHAGYQLEVNT